jgi:hypothetical protein
MVAFPLSSWRSVSEEQDEGEKKLINNKEGKLRCSLAHPNLSPASANRLHCQLPNYNLRRLILMDDL